MWNAPRAVRAHSETEINNKIDDNRKPDTVNYEEWIMMNKRMNELINALALNYGFNDDDDEQPEEPEEILGW